MRDHKKAFFRKIDGPLSALCCNCFQLSCMFPHRDTYCMYKSNSAGTDYTANWMGKFADDNPSSMTPLRDMVLPGTHDSASGTIGRMKPFSAAGRTQNASIKEQLEAGARYLDIRIASSSKGGNLLSIWHGCLEGGKYDDILQDVSDFAQDHPKEVIILELVPEYGKKFSKEQKVLALDLAHQTIGSDMILPATGIREAMQTKPFVEMVGQEQRVLVLVHDRFFEKEGFGMTEDQVTEKYAFGMSKDILRSPWNNTRDVQVLLDKNLTNVSKFETYRGKLLCNQFLATPGAGGVPDVLNLLIGKNSLRPVSHACNLYKANVLDNFLRQNADKPWNIVALDFIDLCPDIVDFLIALNWDQVTMTIETAYMSSNGKEEDVTEKVKSFLCRNRVMFMVDPEDDFGVESKDFTLTIAYSLSTQGATQFYVATEEVHCDCPILISPFCCNQDINQIEVTEDNGVQGFVKKDKIYTSKEEIPGGEDGVALEYNIDGNRCSFSLA